MCGKGRIEVMFWSPNHSFGRGRWDAHLRCSTCREEYALRQRRREVWLELRSELDERDARSRNAYQVSAELRGRVLVPLARAIEETAKSAGRTLRDWHGVISPAFGGIDFENFRREVRSAGNFGEWVAQRVDLSNAERLAELFGIPAPDLPDLLRAYRAAEARVRDTVVTRVELPT